MRIDRLALILVVSWLAGCTAMAPVAPVAPGPIQVGGLTLTAGPGWNDLTMSKDDNRAAWTRDGVSIDRLSVFAGIADGETLLEEPKNSGAAFPRFRATMLPNELVAFTESYLGKLFGEGEAVVTTANVRPHRFGPNPGVLFDAAVQVTEGADRKGVIGAFIANQKLYLVMYLAADPYYFELNRAAAEQVITSARL